MPYPVILDDNWKEAPKIAVKAEILPVVKENMTAPNPIWVSVSEAAKMGGVRTKTIRRAIEGKKIVFMVKNNRYSIEIGSVFQWLLSSPKSKRKFLETGIIQYFKK